MSNQKITIADIKSKYNEFLAKEGVSLDYHNLWGHFVWTRISYYPAWLFLKLRISANMVTLSAFIVGFAGCLLLANGSSIGVVIGALLINICAFLDYVDGHVARCRGSSSNYGQFVDSINIHTIGCLFFMSAGIGAFLTFDIHHDPLAYFLSKSILDKSVFLVLGGWASVFYLLLHLVSFIFERTLSRDMLPFIAGLRIKSFSPIIKVGVTLNSATGIVTPVLLVAAIFKFLGTFVSLWALINTLAFVFLLFQMIRKGRV